MTRFLIQSGASTLVALLGLGLFLARADEPGDELKPELEAVRKERTELEAKFNKLKQREGLLERAVEARRNGYYARLEVRGRLEKKTYPSAGVFDVEHIVWTVTAGENTYGLFFDNNPAKSAFLELAEKSQGKTVQATGELAAPRHPHPQLLEVKTFSAPEK